MTTDAEFQVRHDRRESLVRRLCSLMGWKVKTSPVWAGLRKVAMAEASVIGMDKLQEVCERMEFNQINQNAGDVNNPPHREGNLAGAVAALEGRCERAIELLGEIMATTQYPRNRDNLKAGVGLDVLLDCFDRWEKRYRELAAN